MCQRIRSKCCCCLSPRAEVCYCDRCVDSLCQFSSRTTESDHWRLWRSAPLARNVMSEYQGLLDELHRLNHADPGVALRSFGVLRTELAVALRLNVPCEAELPWPDDFWLQSRTMRISARAHRWCMRQTSAMCDAVLFTSRIVACARTHRMTPSLADSFCIFSSAMRMTLLMAEVRCCLL